MTRSAPAGTPALPRAARLRRDARCLAALVAMRLALSLAGYAAIAARMPRPAGVPDSRFYARQLARRIERLAHLVPGASCLTQALALQYCLARAGHAAAIRIGVRRDEAGRFAAHAWVICEGHVVLGAAHTRIGDFTPLTERR